MVVRNEEMATLPGLEKLRELRGLETVTFRGCPMLEALLKDDMFKPKTTPRATEEEDAAGGSEKRKATDGGECTVAEEGGGSKKAKAELTTIADSG